MAQKCNQRFSTDLAGLNVSAWASRQVLWVCLQVCIHVHVCQLMVLNWTATGMLQMSLPLYDDVRQCATLLIILVTLDLCTVQYSIL